jgi:peptide deformylase
MSPIRYYGDPFLRERAAPVRVFDDALRELAGRMTAIMRGARGIGLAAPQIGENARLVVIDASAGGRENETLTLVNPRISRKAGSLTDDEGCLSFPGLRLLVARAFEITVEGADLSGNPVSREARGLMARVIQHELDHLDGILLVDRLPWHSRLKMFFKLHGLKRKYRAGPGRIGEETSEDNGE